MTNMTTILLACQLVALLFIRLLPVWHSRYSGCDSFYFLLTTEAFKRQKRLPVKLPSYYLADIEEQWYPPGFTVFLGIMPKRVVKNLYWLLPCILDVANMGTMDAVLWRITGHTNFILLANAAYMVVPSLTLEYRIMSSRPLASLLLSFFMFSLLLTLTNPSWFWLSVIFWLAIIMTHKLTVQLGLFVAIYTSLAFKSWMPLTIVLGGITLAALLTRGLYLKMMRGHWDIVSFWHRQWPWLNAHQVNDSPVYGPPGRFEEMKTTCWKRHLQHGCRVFLHNPFFIIPMLSLVAPYVPLPSRLALPAGWPLSHILAPSGAEALLYKLCVSWAAATLVWALLTACIPIFRSLGEGYKYAKYAAIPSAILLTALPLPGYVSLMAVASVLTIASIVRSRRKTISRAGRIDKDFMELLEWIKATPQVDRIGSISTHMMDAIAYHCRRAVLWGGHHYLYNKRLADFFPVFRKRIEDLAVLYDLKYWIIDTNYVDPAVLGLKIPDKRFGPYFVFTAPRKQT